MVCPHPINLRGVLEKIQEQLLRQILTPSVLLQIQMIQLCMTLSCNSASDYVDYLFSPVCFLILLIVNIVKL